MKEKKMVDKLQEFNSTYQILKKASDKITEELKDLETRREEILKNAVIDIDNEKEILLKKLLPIENAMNALNPSGMVSYNPETGWREKVLWALQTSNKVLPVSSIVSKIKENEQNHETEITPVIRLTINRMNDKKQIIRFRNEYLKGIHYGLPEWFINEKLIEGYN